MCNTPPSIGSAWMRWRSQKEPVDLWSLDLETTGVDLNNDHIVEIGIVPVRGRRVVLGEAWSTLVSPPNYRQDGTSIHGLRAADLAEAPTIDQALDQLWQRVGPQPQLLVHHQAIDIGFLRRAHQRQGSQWPKPSVTDTVDLIHRRNRVLLRLSEPEIPLALGQARQRLGLPAAPEHRALDDAVATAELWLALTAPR